MKKNFIKTITIICLLCILLLATLSACSDDSNYDVASFVTYSGDLMKKTQLTQRIDSLDQLNAFCSDADMPIHDKIVWNNTSAMYEKLRSYKKWFFTSKSLIIVFRGYGTPQNVEFANLEIKDDTLTVNLYRYIFLNISGATPAVEDGHLFLIEIKKKSIKGVNQIVANEKLIPVESTT